MSVYDINGHEISGGGGSGRSFRGNAYLYKLKNLNDQGMCTDGTYIYSTTGTVVRKYNILTKAETSETFTTDYYGHGNDMTFNPTTGYLYIATMTQGSPIGVLNASDLTHVEFIELEDGNGNAVTPSQIAYDRKNNKYITASGSVFYIFDSSFEFLSTFDADHGGTHQGIETDGTYIYKCRSGVSGRSLIRVMDMLGEVITQIDVTSNELESVSWDWNGNWYCNTKNSQGLYYTSLFDGVLMEEVAQFHKILSAY